MRAALAVGWAVGVGMEQAGSVWWWWCGEMMVESKMRHHC